MTSYIVADVPEPEKFIVVFHRNMPHFVTNRPHYKGFAGGGLFLVGVLIALRSNAAKESAVIATPKIFQEIIQLSLLLRYGVILSGSVDKTFRLSLVSFLSP